MSEQRVFGALLPAVALIAFVLLSSATLAAQANQRSMFVSAVDNSGAPVPDLGPGDFLVREDSIAREVLSVSAADAPMQIEILVDNSEAAQDYIQDTRRALTSFVTELLKTTEPGRRNEVGLVALADRPTILTQSTMDAAEVKKGIDRLFAQNGAGNYLLEGIIEVSNGFRKRGAARPVIVAITTEGPEFSSRHFDMVLGPLRDAGAALHAFVVGPSSNDQSDEGQNRSIVLDRGPRNTGGRFEHVLTSLALGGKLLQLANELNHQYRVTFARPQSLIPPDTTTVSATRPGVTARGTLIKEPGRP
jgi:hypothetical protein